MRDNNWGQFTIETLVGTARPTRKLFRRVESGYRSDIDGLRAIAVVLVVLFHAGFPVTPGGFVGVDVFFVISGYLITGLLVREIALTGRIGLRDFWARRMRRILPAAVLVLCVSLIAAALFLPALQASRAAKEMPAAALYFINWRFADRATDYFASDQAPSIFLHYWSLAIEEQFYLVWPLILGFALIAGRRLLGGGDTRAILTATITVSVLSFALCLILTADNQPLAFFGTHTRAWQLCVGGVVALIAFGSLATGVRNLLAACGIASILAAAFFLDEASRYPGLFALLPTFGAASIILSGRNVDAPAGHAGGWVGRSLSHPLLAGIGRRSYSWYLWHWPVLVIGEAIIPHISAVGICFLILISLALAFATYAIVEQPARYWPVLTGSVSLSLIFGAVLSVGAAAFGLVGESTFARQFILLNDGRKIAVESVFDDRSQLKHDNCLLSHDAVYSSACVYGNTDGERVAVIFGDSHAAAWFPAVDAAAKRAGWKLVVRTKASCASIEAPTYYKKLNRPYHECHAWRERTIREIIEMDPELIFLANMSGPPVLDSSFRLLRGRDALKVRRAGEDALNGRLLSSTNANIRILRDVPSRKGDLPVCLLAHPGDEEACIWEKKAGRYPELKYGKTPRIQVIDLTDAICPARKCHPVVGGRLILWDSHHLTKSFAETLSEHFDPLFGEPGLSKLERPTPP
ncbi:acyltransferase family protein [Methyloligella solikamskensis]|uniref:Acyltransferase family protein n=1 Tax=Methyloligella solikamskensis TaxID=1177756 RepID=A0ABW3J7V7_9HYPH